MQHTCVNRVDMSENSMQGPVNLVISLFSIYFLDYLDLKANNITRLKLVISEQQFNDNHANDAQFDTQNAPYHYFYGSTEVQQALAASNASTKAHTVVDLKANEWFACDEDCSLYKQLAAISFVKIVHKCYTIEYERRCRIESEHVETVRALNRKFRVLFSVMCVVLVVMSLFALNYLCTDILKQKDTRLIGRVRLNMYRAASYFDCRRCGREGSGLGLNLSSKITGFQYSKLNENNVRTGTNSAGASQIEINNV